jgi:hypothetical protein
MSRKSPTSLTLGPLAFLLALVACALPRPVASQALRSRAGRYELEVLVDGVPARTYQHQGETHILGEQGNRYILRVHNRSNQRIEAVVTVDGLDVMDGQAGDFVKRGYLVPAHGSVDIDGWRLNVREAAAFRFAAIVDSYAAKTGRPRNIGVIGVGVFPERRVYSAPLQPIVPQPSPGYEDRAADSAGLGALKPESEQQPSAAEPARPQKSSAGGQSNAAVESKPAAPQTNMRRSRSGLGTEFGEAVSSIIQEVEFERANSSQPAVLLGARYNDRAGLLALGIDVDGCDDIALRQSAAPFPVSARSYARPPADWRRD